MDMTEHSQALPRAVPGRLSRVATVLAALVFAAFAVALALPAGAQSCGNCGPKSRTSTSGESPDLPGGFLATLNDSNTRDIVLILHGIDATCGRELDPRYRIDCLRATYVRLANQIPGTGDYAAVQDALFAAARKLDTIVKANVDPALPTIRPRLQGKGGGRHIQPIRAVAKDKLRAANAQAAKVVKETGLLILRSGDRPPKRTLHFQQVAAAVGDNLILLRSS